MTILTVFHSGNPAWISCQKAIGVAKAMQEKYDGSLVVNIFTTDSEEAKKYNFRSSTNVLYNDELLPIDVATNKDKLDNYLSKNI